MRNTRGKQARAAISCTRCARRSDPDDLTMEQLAVILDVMTAAVFGVIAAIAIVRWVRDRSAPTKWLALAFFVPRRADSSSSDG
jgi:hypothetical protein